MRRPLVVITATSRRETPADPERVRLNAAYVDAVTRAGGIPVVAPPTSVDDAAAVLDAADALMLTGGEDVDPARYGAAPHPALGRVTPARDAWELALVNVARQRGLPTLAVCRGIQVLNVALGGTLLQDIPSEHPGAIPHDQAAPRTERTHAVTFAAGSRLAGIFGPSGSVNSMHHQAVARPATGLAVTAVAPDGIVEGVEWTGERWWAVGIQWHPEELEGSDQGLFAALVEAARGEISPPSATAPRPQPGA